MVLVFVAASNTQAQNVDLNWKDSTYKIIPLQNKLTGKRIIEYNGLRPAIIFLAYDDVRNTCLERLKNEPGKEEYKDLLNFFDSMTTGKDTIKLSENNNELNKMVSDLLMKGQAKVFGINRQKFMDSISYRDEKYGTELWRFYYLPYKRPFFAIMESSAVVEENNNLMKTLGKNPGEYKQLSDKLKKIWKQN